MENLKSTMQQLRWKLTLSYSAVTVGSLLVVVLILGYLVFSRAFIPIDIYTRVLTPEEWIRIIAEDDAALVRSLLSHHPINTEFIGAMMQEGELTITEIDILQIGDFQIRLMTEGRGGTLLLDQDGILVGTNTPDLVAQEAVGQPLDRGILPGLEETLDAALRGVMDPEQLFVTLEPHERFYFAVPVMDENNQEVLGAVIIYMEHIPTANDIPETLMLLLGRSVLILLLSAGFVGTIFGALTARGMVARFDRVSQVTDAWSQGDFSEFINDPTGDEISQLAQRLNSMAAQLQALLRRRQEMAVSEERNRLARDLHDSAKQQALAASFQLGTAITLFDRDPGAAKEHLLEAENLVDSVRKELTDLIHELRPASMEGRDLSEVLNEYAVEWALQNDVEIDVNIQGSEEIPLETKQSLYRIMQEALANIARHSGAGYVDLVLNYEPGMVSLSINDDGEGFDTSSQHDGMGLQSMRERAEALDGTFSIDSEPGQGTNICVTFPIS